MMNTHIHFLALFALFGLATASAGITFVQRPTEGTQYKTLAVRFTGDLHLADPFDLVTNSVELQIIAPDYSRKVLSFFFDGPGKDSLDQWEARFAPDQPGRYRMRVAINGETQSEFEVSVAANKEKKQGGLVLSGRLGNFAFGSGEPFRGIGINVCWTDNYEYYFKKMRASGMNVTRIWLCPWNLSFEWQETGLGRYNLQSARRLDSILEMAKRYGIYVILCMDYHGVAPKGMGYFRENRWAQNPYNKANGGPCVSAADLFTNSEAKEFQKRKYKYIVSRFGHSANIAAWEFYNETDLMAGQSIPVNRWHIEMAEFIRSVDVHHRLVSTSSTRSFPEKVVDAFKDPAMDFVMFHEYNNLNFAPYIVALHEATTEYYRKPVVLAEFGVEYRGADMTYQFDPQHVGLHNGIWAGWFSETPIAPLSWWWDNYIDRHDLWYEFANLHRFADSMDFSAKYIAYETVTPGTRVDSLRDQARCMVRCVYTGEQCAVWFKNEDYQWSLMMDGKDPKETGAFLQVIHGFVPGRYRVLWYDPQTGRFAGQSITAEVRGDGGLTLSVPTFTRDLACLVRRLRE